MKNLKNFFLGIFDADRRFVWAEKPSGEPEGVSEKAEAIALKKTLEEMTNQDVINLTQWLDGSAGLGNDEWTALRNLGVMEAKGKLKARDEAYSGSVDPLIESKDYKKFLEALRTKRPEMYEAYQGYVAEVQATMTEGKEARDEVRAEVSEETPAPATTPTPAAPEESVGERRAAAVERTDAMINYEKVENAVENQDEFLGIRAKMPEEFRKVQTLVSPEFGTTEQVRIGTSELEWSRFMKHMEGGGENFYRLWEGVGSLDFGDETQTQARQRLNAEEREVKKRGKKELRELRRIKDRMNAYVLNKKDLESAAELGVELPVDIETFKTRDIEDPETFKEIANAVQATIDTMKEDTGVEEDLARIAKEKEMISLLYPKKVREDSSPTVMFVECIRRIGAPEDGALTLTFNDISKTVLGMRGSEVLEQYEGLKAMEGEVEGTDMEAIVADRIDRLEAFISSADKILATFPELSLESMESTEEVEEAEEPEHETLDDRIPEVSQEIDGVQYPLSEIVSGVEGDEKIAFSALLADDMVTFVENYLNDIRDYLPEGNPFKDPEFDVKRNIDHSVLLKAIVDTCGYENLVNEGLVSKTPEGPVGGGVLVLNTMPAAAKDSVKELLSKMVAPDNPEALQNLGTEEYPRYAVEWTESDVKLAQRTYKLNRAEAAGATQEELDQILWQEIIEDQLDEIFDKNDLGPEIRRKIGDGIRRKPYRDVLNMELLERTTATPDDIMGKTASGRHAYELTRSHVGEYAEAGEFLLQVDTVVEELNNLLLSGIEGAGSNPELRERLGVTTDEEYRDLLHAVRVLQLFPDSLTEEQQATLDKAGLDNIQVTKDNLANGNLNDLQTALIRRGFAYSQTIESVEDSTELREVALNNFDEATNQILKDVYRASIEQGVDLTAEDILSAGREIQNFFAGGVGVVVDVEDVYDADGNFEERNVAAAVSAQGVIPLGKGFYCNAGIINNRPTAGIGAGGEIPDTSGQRAAFNITFSPTTPDRAVSVGGGLTAPLGKGWELGLGMSAGAGLTGVEVPGVTLGVHRNLEEAANARFEELSESNQGEINAAIEMAATTMEGGLTDREIESLRAEIMTFFGDEMWETAQEDVIKPFQLTGAGVTVKVGVPPVVMPVLTFAIGGKTLVKRVRKESDLEMNLLAEARLKEHFEGATFGQPLFREGRALIGSSGRLSVDAESGSLELDSFSETGMSLPDVNASTLEAYNDTMNTIGVNLELTEDGNHLDVQIKNADGLVRVVLDPKLKAKLEGDPSNLRMEIDQETPLVIKREDFRYPFNHFGATTHTVITLTTDPSVTRATIEGEMEHEGNQMLTYLQYGPDGNIREYGGHEEDNIDFYPDGMPDEAIESVEYDFTRDIDLEGKKDALSAMHEAITSKEEFTVRPGELKTLAEQIVNGETAVDFRRESLAELGSTEALVTMFNEAAGRELNDAEFNLLLQYATDASFRNLSEQAKEDPEAAQRILAKEIKNFALPTLTRRLESVVTPKAKARKYAAEILKRTYQINKIGDLPRIDLLTQDYARLDGGTQYEVLAGTKGQVGSRAGFNLDKMLANSLVEFNLESTDATEAGIARAMLELMSPVPAENKEFLRSPLALKVAAFLPVFFTPEHAMEIVEMYNNPDTANFENESFQKFRALVERIREAELAGQRTVEIPSEDGFTFMLEFTSLKTETGVYGECANETIGLSEKFAIYMVEDVQVAAGGTEVVSHASSETIKNYVEFGLTAGVKHRQTTRTEDVGGKEPGTGVDDEKIDPEDWEGHGNEGDFEGGDEEAPGDDSGIF